MRTGRGPESAGAACSCGWLTSTLGARKLLIWRRRASSGPKTASWSASRCSASTLARRRASNSSLHSSSRFGFGYDDPARLLYRSVCFHELLPASFRGKSVRSEPFEDVLLFIHICAQGCVRRSSATLVTHLCR